MIISAINAMTMTPAGGGHLQGTRAHARRSRHGHDDGREAAVVVLRASWRRDLVVPLVEPGRDQFHLPRADHSSPAASR